MAKIDIDLLKSQVVNRASRADLVRRDPAVIAATKQFKADSTEALNSLRHALNSGRELFVETKEAWTHSGESGLYAGPEVRRPVAQLGNQEFTRP